MFEASFTPPQRLVWSVAALLQATGDALAARFGAVVVRGELSSFTRAGSGHCYFALKDGGGAAALLRCAMFRRAAALLDFDPADGQQVELRGRLGVYDPRGELQIVAESLRRVGAGTLYEEFVRLQARLEAQGLFAADRKRPLAPFPRTLGIVTSLAAAALHDVLSTLARRSPHVRVIVYPCPVQGADAPPAIAAALALANAQAEVDTLLLVRGGGALEDLWAFNDERVVRAVVASRIPVVCGVGHETDVTLADRAADVRAPTPTAAAELAAPPHATLSLDLDGHERRHARVLVRWLERERQRLDAAALRIGRPAASLALQRQRLADAEQRLRQARAVYLMRHAQALRVAAHQLHAAAAAQRKHWQAQTTAWTNRLAALDPKHVLQRGYAWIEGSGGRPIVSVRQLAPGDAIRAVWADGRAHADVSSVEALDQPCVTKGD